MPEIQNVRYRHEGIIDLMLANPNLNQNAIAEMLGFTQAWLSTVVNSSAFKAEYARRRREFNEELAYGTTRKLYAVVDKASDRILDALGRDDIDPRFALDAADKVLHRLGFAPDKSGVSIFQKTTEVNFNVTTDSEKRALRDAREAIIGRVLEHREEE